MTLVISAGNSEQIIQVSDRRLTNRGKLVNDESSKAIILHCGNARLSVSYTGLASVGKSFITRKWLLKTISECAPPDYTAEQIIIRFTERATREFSENPFLKNLPKASKRLTIMFTGYLYHHAHPLAALAIVSNYQDIDKNQKLNYALDKFTHYFRQGPGPGPNVGNFALIFAIGTLPPIKKEQNQLLREVVKNKIPARKIVDLLVEIIRKLADHPSSGNTIGKQLDSVTIPKDIQMMVTSSYHSEKVRKEGLMVDTIMAVSDKLHMTVGNIKVTPRSKNASPLTGPKLRSKQLCWCPSGKKYKYCHGKKQDNGQSFFLEFTPDD